MEMISPSMGSATAMARADFPLAVGPVMTRASLRGASPVPGWARRAVDSAMATEASLERLEREPDDGWPSVDVVGGELGREEAVVELFHLAGRETLSGFDGRLAGEGHGDPLVLVPGGAGEFAAGGEFGDHLAEAAFGVEVGVRRRGGVDDD